MNNQALVDALIKFQNWCDEWPKIKDHIGALAAENAKLRERVAELEAVRVAVMPRSSTGHPAATHRCGICGGVVQFDGTPPNPECWPAGKKRKEPA